jgi:hypothetical protein
MTSQLNTLLIKSSQLQRDIAAARASRNPDWIRVLRLQSLKLAVQGRIAALTYYRAPQPILVPAKRRPALRPRSALLH